MQCTVIRLILVLAAGAALLAPLVLGNTIADEIRTRSASGETDAASLSLFRDALRATGLLDTVLSSSAASSTPYITVFAPTNQAIWGSPQMQVYMQGLDELPYPRWHHHLLHAVQQHIVVDESKAWTHADIFDRQTTELLSLRDPIVVNQWESLVANANVIEPDGMATNGILHVVDSVFPANFLSEPFSQLELQLEYGPDYLERTALVDVVDFVEARDELNLVREEGMTFVGCRIRGFNRIEEYLTSTVNGSPEGVVLGEFLNETFKEETMRNFIKYNMLPKNYYYDDIPNDNKFVELIEPIANCGHMWVTKRDGKLCFNNGCVVETPDRREYSAANG